MKRALKIVSRKTAGSIEQDMLRVKSEKRKNELVGTNALSGQGTAHMEKKHSTLNTINELVITISHYLNSPLTVLLGKVELLSQVNENGGISREDIERFVEASKREIFRIDAIVKAFQDLCRVHHKTYPPGVKMLDVEKEVKERLKEIQVCKTDKLF
jgi:K+-sensing histidine kinase KdpD